MALDDYMEPEVGVAIAATALIASPQVRGFLRKGAVYGMAGLMMAGDAVTSFARAAGRGAQQAADEAAEIGEEMTENEDITASDEAESPIIVPGRPRAATRRPVTPRRRATKEAIANA